MKHGRSLHEPGIQQGREWKIKRPGGATRSVTVHPRLHFLPETDFGRQEESELVYEQIQPVIEFLGYSQQELADTFEVDPSTLLRWRKGHKTIGRQRSLNIYRIDEIIAKGIRIFGSEEELGKWMNAKNLSLGGEKPSDLLKDPFSINLVDDAIEALSWGNIM